MNTLTAFAVSVLVRTPAPVMAQQHVVSAVAPATTEEARQVMARHVTVELTNVSLKEALDVVAAKAGVQMQYIPEVIAAANIPVTLHAEQVTLRVVLNQMLNGTDLRVVVGPSGRIAVVPGRQLQDVAAAMSGIIAGHVTDAITGHALSGATIVLDDATRGVVTGNDGSYRISGVTAGTHRVRVRLLGYGRQTKVAAVTDDATVMVDLALSTSANTLDQVVVTGTVIPTELRAVPNAITVITAKDLEQRGITHIDQLFHGDVPGLFAQNQGDAGTQPGQIKMASRGSTKLEDGSGTALAQTIKTYVDGVELADPSYLGLIDPKSIDRIEILTGPQASTIYGSNAINGVMQVFTKRGSTSKPQLTVALQSGVIQNNFSSAMTPQHDYSAQVAGVEGHMSYNVGGAWTYQGPWTPSVHQAFISGFGGARFQQAPFAFDVSLRRTVGTNWSSGAPAQQLIMNFVDGLYNTAGQTFYISNYTTSTSNAQTLGGTLTYTPVSWWSHTVQIGTDATVAGSQQQTQGYAYPSDTTLILQTSTANRSSFSYVSALHAPLTSVAMADVTAGADGWHALTSSQYLSPTSLTGTLNGNISLSRQPSHDHGAFVQAQLGLISTLFLTYGVRWEWNPTYGRDANPTMVPRYGVAYTQSIGALTYKLRASYGHSTRPPAVALTQAKKNLNDVIISKWGYIDTQRANPDLLPEQQRGGEGGLELYFGNRGSIVVTRYNQTVDNLIANAKVLDDSLQSFQTAAYYNQGPYPQWPSGYEYYIQTQNLNLGSIRNQGWEGQGTIHMGPLSVDGTYSFTKSRIIGMTQKYRAQFPQYVPGGIFAGIPEHTYAIGVQYTNAATTIALNVHGQSQLVLTGNDDLYYVVKTGLRLKAANSPRVTLPATYSSLANGYALTDLNASRRISGHVDGLFQVQNLGNSYRGDFGAPYASIGRQSRLGVRIRS